MISMTIRDRFMTSTKLILITTSLLSFSTFLLAEDPKQEGTKHQEVKYEKDVAPILRKYCAGCHNDADREGEFSLESYASLSKGTEDGPAFLAAEAETSLMFRLINQNSDEQMPPEGEPQPSQEDVEIIRVWIEQGAKGPAGEVPDRLSLHVPTIPTKTDRSPITAVDWSADGKAIAIARYSQVQIIAKENSKVLQTLEDFPGKVTSVHFCLDDDHLMTSSGVTGLGGVAALWNWQTGEKVREYKGHRDLMFDAAVSPNGELLATCSYDRSMLLWDLKSGENIREFVGHNGAIYDLEFSADSQTLVSASADSTCKVWRVKDAERMDTLGQPLKEQYRVSLSPDGRSVAAAGADNRIRIWRLVSNSAPKINPLLFARYAHEGPIISLQYTPDGKHLVSIAEDKTIKVWETKTYTETQLIDGESEVAMALAIAPDSRQFIMGRLDGSIDYQEITQSAPVDSGDETAIAIVPQSLKPQEPKKLKEKEPNQTAQTAQAVTLPAIIEGEINLKGADVDADCYQFSAKTGEEWVFEINAARSKSLLDSTIEVLTKDGKPIERVLLQAVRDSYFTFRGKTADQTSDFRVFNWQEMELNEYLYANGDVTRLWLYPRGPDSGFNVYPGTGLRWGYFDSTPLAHALGEPCYIVEPHPPGTKLIANGLPVFKIYYKNDDESHRKSGKDSKLFFTAPESNEYVVRVRDVRGVDGEKFHYTLNARPREEDFAVKLVDKSTLIPAGGAKEIRFTAERMDQFEGAITIHVEGLPEGYRVSAPIKIQAGQMSALGVISASKDAKPMSGEAIKNIQLTATADVSGKSRKHEVQSFQELKIDEAPKLQLAITEAPGGIKAVRSDEEGPLEFEIEPGETIMLQVSADRINHKGEIPFGKEDAGRNLPHGLFVDNIGLNGLLLLNDQSQREFYITAAKWVPEQSRLFHLRTTTAGAPATQPLLLHIRKKSSSNASGAE